MTEIQGKSILVRGSGKSIQVRVNAGSSYRQSTVLTRALAHILKHNKTLIMLGLALILDHRPSTNTCKPILRILPVLSALCQNCVNWQEKLFIIFNLRNKETETRKPGNNFLLVTRVVRSCRQKIIYENKLRSLFFQSSEANGLSKIAGSNQRKYPR